MTPIRSLSFSSLVVMGTLMAPLALAQTPEATPNPVQQASEKAEIRRDLEAETADNPLAITAYRRNYVMPWTYNTNPDEADFREISTDGGVDHSEVKFQLSFKVKLLDDVLGHNGDLYFAYTQRSWWQAYNSEASSPFRETNYEPEAFMSFDNSWTVLGWTNTINRVGFAHQSNGRSDPLSRSWNRLYAETIFQRGDWAFSLAPHWRIPEKARDDDNPDLEDYIGYGDFTLVRAIGDQEVSLMVRGNPGQAHYGGQLDYSFPLFGKVRGYVQYYRGYGESLIDYDHDVQRFGLGFSINTFLAGIPGTR
ncbi:phospholipase [Salinicola endophyticus]|uniref:Phospholipase A1 n=2 Tax=Salinicola endophyticus TaxID=1949083 RepID=A0ABY8FKF0_9GAMM|nr:MULTISPECIES: phospholipase A [Salinicola]WFF43278.1 phospholipase [Salinicola endophyticus]